MFVSVRSNSCALWDCKLYCFVLTGQDDIQQVHGKKRKTKIEHVESQVVLSVSGCDKSEVMHKSHMNIALWRGER